MPPGSAERLKDAGAIRASMLGLSAQARLAVE